jgi:hypothetical protein
MKGVPAGNAEQVDQKEVGMEQRRQWEIGIEDGMLLQI